MAKGCFSAKRLFGPVLTELFAMHKVVVNRFSSKYCEESHFPVVITTKISKNSYLLIGDNIGEDT